MKKRIIVILALLLSFSTTYGSYSDISQNTIKVFDTFYSITKKNSRTDAGLQYLKALQYALDNIANGKNINANNANTIGELQKLNNEKIFSLEYDKLEQSNKSKIDSISSLSYFDKFIYNDYFIGKENGVWYFYEIIEQGIINDNKGNAITNITQEILRQTNLLSKNTVVFVVDGNIGFITNYKKIKIISDDIIYGFPNKMDLLITLRNNKLLSATNDDDSSFKTLEKLSLSLTEGLYTNNQKIGAIYTYILENISYTLNPDLSDYKISSGIETFKNKDGVCEGYIELLQLMLGFNNIPSDILPGDVIDANDFPNIGHGWVKIFDYYYDPTFDDPIGTEITRTQNEYEYYRLPKDLFYTDRYDEGQTPEYLKTASLEDRKSIIRNNRANLYSKYKIANYNLLVSYKFKDENGIPLNKKITISDIKDKMTYGEFDGQTIITKSNSRSVKSLKYYEVDDSNIGTFLDKIKYDLSDYTLMLWKKQDGTTGYIISKNSEIQ